MDKIIVVSGGSEHDKDLVYSLKTFFPECYIDVQPRKPKYQVIDRPGEANFTEKSISA